MHPPGVKKAKDAEECTKSPRFPSSSMARRHQVLLFTTMLILGLFLLPRNPILDNREEWRPLEMGENKDHLMKRNEAMVVLGEEGMPGRSAVPLQQNSTLVVRGQDGGSPGCDFTRGEWVPDRSNRPLYSGDACKQWLSQAWHCRQDKSRDLSYEQYRWQPQGCDLPAFRGLDFLQRMRNRTIAFIGDSIGRQQYQSLMCMISGTAAAEAGELEVVDVSDTYGFILPGNARPLGWAQKFLLTNTTVLYYWSSSLCEIGPASNSSGGFSPLHLDRIDTFLQKNVHRLDVVVVNTGHHWNRWKIKENRWDFYLDGKPAHENLTVNEARRLAVLNAAQRLDEQVKWRPELRVFLRSLSPRHFVGGEWNSGGRCDNINSNSNSSSSSVRTARFQADADAGDAAGRSSRIQLLDISRLSWSRGESHIAKFLKKSGQDCLHWCLPGIPDTWNEILAACL